MGIDLEAFEHVATFREFTAGNEVNLHTGESYVSVSTPVAATAEEALQTHIIDIELAFGRSSTLEHVLSLVGMLNLTIDAQLVQGIVDVAGLVGMLQHSLSLGNDISSHAILLCKRNGLLDELQRLLDATNVAQCLLEGLDSFLEGSEVGLRGSSLHRLEGSGIEVGSHTVELLSLGHHISVVLSCSQSIAQCSGSAGDSRCVSAIEGSLGIVKGFLQYSHLDASVTLSLGDSSAQVAFHIRKVNL